MSFLAPFLLALSVFASIPILLHLIRRRRVRVLELPTFQFLKKAAEQQRVKFHLQDQLLMLLRILILVLLALAFAGPLGEQREGRAGPVLQPKNVLLLDDTLSMSIEGDTGLTSYQSAQQFVLDLIWENGADWRVGLASDFLGQRDPDSFLATGYEETVDLLERNPSPEAKGALDAAIDKATVLLDDQTALWVVSDAAATNWSTISEEDNGDPRLIELIQTNGLTDASNWALTDLSLNNQPLLENEPALLTSRVEFFGDNGSGASPPPLVQYGLRSNSGQALSDRYQPELSSAGQFVVQSTIPTEGTITSASASLSFSEEDKESLFRDNQAVLIPRFLEGVQILVVTETEEWAKIIQSALVGFDSSVTLNSQAPPGDAASFSAYIFLLEREVPEESWSRFLEQRIQAGAGVLFLFDGRPEPIRIQNWSEWWNRWGAAQTIASLFEGPKEIRPGAEEWLFDSIDPTAKKTEWAEKGFQTVQLEGWRSELELADTTGSRTPVFQTRAMGQGTAASWGVPLSPRDTSLLYSAAWVPMLSQFVKRTLIEPGTISKNTFESMRLESQLASLSQEDQAQLVGAGLRFYSLDDVASRIGSLSQGRQNWTALILLLCLLLALVEIGVSNHV